MGLRTPGFEAIICDFVSSLVTSTVDNNIEDTIKIINNIPDFVSIIEESPTA